jgi:hypothetical protein
MELVLIVAVVLLFELAAMRWGVDSRDLFHLNDSLDHFNPFQQD